MFAVKLEHTLDDIYQKFGKIRLKDLAPDVQEKLQSIIDMIDDMDGLLNDPVLRFPIGDNSDPLDYPRVELRKSGNEGSYRLSFVYATDENTKTFYTVVDDDGSQTSFFKRVWPVGSIYMSVNTTSPASLFGGTWERLKSRFLLGADDSTYANAATGGAATINLEHNHTTGDHKLVEKELPQIDGSFGAAVPSSHANFRTGNAYAKTFANTGNIVNSGKANTTIYGYGFKFGSNNTHNHGNTGNKLSSAQSIMPPYLVVYMWKRTA